ncbi:MAG: aldo/keto reductase [Planctomycetota bacterium]
MQTRRLGPDAPAVSELGYGGMPLSLEERPDEAAAIRTLHAVLDAGVTLIDTADVYCQGPHELGHNERLIGKALREWSGDRDRLVVATKGGSSRPDAQRWKADGRPEHLREACEASLENLGVEQIDLYQLHGPDPQVPFEDSVGAIAELQRAGKVRWVGVSNVTVKQLDAARRIMPVQSVQNLLNPYFRGALRGRLWRKGLLAHCRKLGVGFLAFSPVGGLLAQKTKDHPVLARIAQEHGCSNYRVVLAWLLAKAPNVIPIPSARSVEHALDSVAAAELRLSAEQLAAIDAAEFPR